MRDDTMQPSTASTTVVLDSNSVVGRTLLVQDAEAKIERSTVSNNVSGRSARLIPVNLQRWLALCKRRARRNGSLRTTYQQASESWGAKLCMRSGLPVHHVSGARAACLLDDAPAFSWSMIEAVIGRLCPDNTLNMPDQLTEGTVIDQLCLRPPLTPVLVCANS